MDKNGGVPVAAVGGTTVGVYRAYASLFNWESGEENSNITEPTEDDVNPSLDLVSTDTVMNVACYADGVDTAALYILGWTTGIDNYIRIYTPVSSSEVGVSQRHSGKWGDGYQRSNDIIITENYVRVDGLSIKQSSNLPVYFVSSISGAGEVHISNSYGINTTDSPNSVFNIASVDTLTLKIWNNIAITNSTSDGSHAFYLNDTDVTAYFYNNTGVANRGYAFRLTTGVGTLKNNVGFSAQTNDFSGTWTTADFNASVDDTADNWGGVGNRVNQDFVFVADGDFDYHLASSDSSALDQGTDLSTDTFLPISDDIDGELRAGAWDIGADDNTTTDITIHSATLYRSLGISTADLNTNSETLTIIGATANFSGALPENIGVGDVLQYQVSGTNYAAFIQGRTSSSLFTVQDSTGGIPQATVAGTAVNIYRAYNSLEAWHTQGVDFVNANIHNDIIEKILLPSRNIAANDTIIMLACYADGVDSAGEVNIKGWTTDADNYIYIYTPTLANEVGVSQRHDGTWGSGYRRTDELSVATNYLRIDGLSSKVSGIFNYPFVFAFISGVGEVHISNSYAHYTNNDDSDSLKVLFVDTLTVKVWNNILITDSTNVNSNALDIVEPGITAYIYNNTGIANAGAAFRRNLGTAIIKNNLGFSSTNVAFVGAWSSAENNASDDDTADDWGGAGNRINQTFSFVDESNDDYRLLANDVGAKNFGSDLSSDPNIAFSDDIEQNDRGYGGTWDIGADEYTVGNDFIWDGGGSSTNWVDALNWDRDQGFPSSAGDTATINSGADSIVGATAGLTLGSLSLEGGYTGTLTLASALTISNSNERDGSLVLNAGSLDVGNSNYPISVTGNWTVSGGTLIQRTGTVTFSGANQQITGSTTFYNLTKIDSNNNGIDETLTFDSSATQTIAPGGTLTLNGIDDDDRINLVSDSSGIRFRFNISTNQNVSWLEIRDTEVLGTADIIASNLLQSSNTDLNELSPHWVGIASSGSISGCVRLSSLASRTLAGAIVTIGSQSTTTGADGCYSFSNVAPGTYTVTVTKDKFKISQATQVPVSSGNDVISNFVAKPALRTTLYTFWNGFENMENILELLNTSDSSDLFARITLFGRNGLSDNSNIQAQSYFSIAANSQVDLPLSSVDGFAKKAYGIAKIELNQTSFDGRITNYGLDQQVAFSYAASFENALVGKSYLIYNTNQAGMRRTAGADAVVPWLSLANLDPLYAKSFVINRYDEFGTIIETSSLVVPPLGRTDIRGAHNGAAAGRVGLNEIVPIDNNAEYIANLVRYGGSLDENGKRKYRYAIPFSAVQNTNSEQNLTLSKGAGAFTWLELANISPSVQNVQLEVYTNLGQQVDSKWLTLAAYAQQHLDIAALLSPGQSGYLKVTAAENDAILAQAVSYYRDANGDVSAATSSQARDVYGTVAHGSYNLFLNSNNWLRLNNISNQAIDVTLTAESGAVTYNLAPNAGKDVPLSCLTDTTATKDCYGKYTLETTVSGSLLADVLRLGISDEGKLIFSSSNPAR